MRGDEHPHLVRLRTTREAVIGALSEAFATDEIGMEEFERRVDRAYAAKTPEELTSL